MTKVAINGFGRIGRLVFRGLLDRTDLDIVAINNPSGPETAAYLLKYDTVHGRLNKKVEIDKDDLIVDGKRIHVFQDRNPENLDWSAYGTEIVIESTGKLKDRESAGKHIRGTVKKVIITAPGKDEDATIVVGVNENIYDPAKDDIISNASCTTNCLAPMAKALNDAYPIQSGIMTTVHAYTGDQMILDGPQRKGDLRRSRAGAQNIVPNSTGAAKAIGLVIPELNGKLIGSAQRVPTPTGSTTILVAVVKGKDITVEGVNAAMKAATTESFGYTEEQIVSSDIVGMKYGSLFDATQTMVAKVDDDTYHVQVVSWYDNENSYTSQMVRTIKYFAEI